MAAELREVWLIESSDQIVRGIHPRSWCQGRGCVVHNPGDHSMRNFQLWFELSSKTFARTCDHMLSHHDPDERNYWLEKLEQAESDGHDSLIELAAGKLLAWDCPNCECGCCA